ncbi:MAG: hypothetical protein FJ387_03655 [Verrucomicrobia bacterium]|nr:hypothetical protein [Verrucomicrobiota bacterium]
MFGQPWVESLDPFGPREPNNEVDVDEKGSFLESRATNNGQLCSRSTTATGRGAANDDLVPLELHPLPVWMLLVSSLDLSRV